MRYRGIVGVKGAPIETAPGVFVPDIIEHTVSGNMQTKGVRWRAGELSQDSVRANHVLSVIAPASMMDDFSDILYVEWQNRKWTVTTIEYAHPRIQLTLGGVYDG